jgi:hypothetical protein
MEKVTTEKQLTVTAEDRPGILSDVAGLIAESGVNIENFCAYNCGGQAILRLITDDNPKAVQALRLAGFRIEETEVILLRLWNRPGTLATVTSRLKPHGINLDHIYGTSTRTGERITAVFSSDDNEKAAEIFTSLALEEG